MVRSLSCISAGPLGSMREMLIGSNLMTLGLFPVDDGIKNEMEIARASDDHSNV